MQDRQGSLHTESDKRILRYKEERRRQLAAQVAHRLNTNVSSSEEDEQSDRRSFAEYKRRRRRERGAKPSSQVSSRHNLNSSGGELHHSRSRGSPDIPKESIGSQESPTGPLESTRGPQESPRRVSDGSRGSAEAASHAHEESPDPVRGSDSHPSSGSRSKGSLVAVDPRSGSRGSSEVTNGWNYEYEATLRSKSVERFGGHKDNSGRLGGHRDHLEPTNQVLTESRDFSAALLRTRQIHSLRSQEQSTDSNSNLSPAYSRDSLLDRSGSRDSLGDKDGAVERENLESPDLIKSAACQITPVPRRRKKASDECSTPGSRFSSGSKPNLDLILAKPNPDLRPESSKPSPDLNCSKLNQAPGNPESPGSVLSPSSNPSASKPPIFPTPDRTSGGFKFSLRKSGDSPPGFMRSESRSDSEPAPFIKEFASIVKRRSGHFNPNEVAPPKPSQRPHSVYKMDTQTKTRASEPDLFLALGDKERRRSDFLSHYEELTCRAAQAIKSVDRIVREPATPLPSPGSYLPNSPLYSGAGLPSPLYQGSSLPSPLYHGSSIPSPLYQGSSLPSPLYQGSCLPSPLSPGVESVEFNEEEVLKTCQDFLLDYNKSKQSTCPAPLDPATGAPPIPAPRFSLSQAGWSRSSPGRSTCWSQPASSRPVSQLSLEDEQLLEAAQGKQFWERDQTEKSFRARSSSFSMPDRSSSFLDSQNNKDTSTVNLRPILKKSTEDLPSFSVQSLPSSTISILKNRDDIFGKAKRRSAGEDGKGEHVRIRSPSPSSRSEHVRIRTPSPDSSDEPRTILRSRDNSCGDDRSDSEIPSILKRRVSADDLGLEDYSGYSPEKTSILKRKASFGSTYSGSHSPEGVAEGTRSILKKSSRNSSRTCSRSASIEDLDIEGTKSILKSRNSSRTCSRSGSQEELDLDLEEGEEQEEDEEEEWSERKPKSILKKQRPGSTDDELEDRPDPPKSILKSRRSEESLSPTAKLRRSEEAISPAAYERGGNQEPNRSGRNYTRHASLPSDHEEIPSGRNSPLVTFPMSDHNIRPILKHREDALPGILKRREKSSSPGREHSPPPDQGSAELPENRFIRPGFGDTRFEESVGRDSRFEDSLEIRENRFGEHWGREARVGEHGSRETRFADIPANREEKYGVSTGPRDTRHAEWYSNREARFLDDSRLRDSEPGFGEASTEGVKTHWSDSRHRPARSSLESEPSSVLRWSPHSSLDKFHLTKLSSPLAATPRRSSPRMTSPLHSSSQSASPRRSSPPRPASPRRFSPRRSCSPLRIREGTPPYLCEVNHEEDEILCIVEQSSSITGLTDPSADPSKLSLAERVKMFDSISSTGQNIGRPPRIGGATGGIVRRRRKQLHSRFQTQPITVDEVEKARKGFLDQGNFPFGGIRTSPLYSMLRPVSLEELGNEVIVPKPRKPVLHTAQSYTAADPEVVVGASATVSRTVIRFSTAKLTDPSITGATDPHPAAGTDRFNQSVTRSPLPRSSLFRPVVSPHQEGGNLSPEEENESRLFNLDPSPPPLYSRSLSGGSGGQRKAGTWSSVLLRNVSPVFQRQRSSPTLPSPSSRDLQRQQSSPPRLFTVSPPPQLADILVEAAPASGRDDEVATGFSRRNLYSPTMLSRPSAFSPPSTGSRHPAYGPGRSSPVFGASAFRSSSPQARSSAFRPVPTGVQSVTAELTPVSGPIPVRFPIVPGCSTGVTSHISDTSSPEDQPSSILKHREEISSSIFSGQRTHEPKVPKKSILKNDSLDDSMMFSRRSMEPPARGVLKKDWSYEGPRANSSPPLYRSNSGSSSEDVGRAFTDVVIDPRPGQGRKSAPETPVKRGCGNRTPVILPSSVKISADGDLAGKLAKLSMQADNIKQKMSSDDRQELADHTETRSNPRTSIPATSPTPPPALLTTPTTPPAPPAHLPPTPTAKHHHSAASRPSRKSDLPKAEDFYALYQRQKRLNSVSPSHTSGTPSPKPALSSGTPSPLSGERRSFRLRSASPQLRKGVEFWEEKGAEHKRGRSQDAENMSARTEVHIPGGGIMERLAALQKHGDEDWRKRAQKQKDTPEILISRSLSETEKKRDLSPVQLRKNQGGVAPAARPVSLMDRMSKLNQAQTQWQKKVEDKDAKKFTVEGKMEREKFVKSVISGDKTPEPREPVSATPVKQAAATAVFTPLNNGHVAKVKGSDRPRRSPQMIKFQGSNTPVRTRPVSLFVHSENTNNERTGSGVRRSSSMKKLESSPSSSPQSSSPTALYYQDIAEENLDCDLERESSYKPSLNTRRTVQPPRRTRGSRNPVKNLLARQDLVTREEDLKYAEDKENRVKVDRSSAHSHLAAEALAGLASTEDFTSVQLRKDKVVIHQNLLPYRSKMLIQVKGRRICQCRLVEPVAASVNSGDSYVLLTPTELFNWQGRFSNVIEKARSAEIALTILQKKELGCKTVSRVQTIEEEKLLQSSRENSRFWAALSSEEQDQPPDPRLAGPPQEDEEYEQSIVESTCVYEVNMLTDELVPVPELWGLPLKYAVLNHEKVLVFDFGAEVYVYSGKNANFEERKVGARLAQELWSAGWDYTGCSINPVYGAYTNVKCTSRPDWTVVGRLSSNMETVLFREKFTDWPDSSRVIGKAANGKEREEFDVNSPPSWAWADLAGWCGSEVHGLERLAPDLQLEGSHLGRGREFYDLEERRQYLVETLEVKCWYVEENTSTPLPPGFTGQLHSQDTYVIRWKYKVALTGRNLKGGASKYSAVGRDRCAYFFWQGEHSKISLQGASALHTVELDSEKGPQLRVTEGSEHAAFLSLFGGQMAVYLGRRGDTNFKEARLFLLRGQDRLETCLKEVECASASLRSHGVFVLVKRGKVMLWVGGNASSHQVEMGEEAARRLSARLPAEMGLGDSATLSTVHSGAETSELLSALGATREEINRMFECDVRLAKTPRLFQLTSVLGSFQVTEVLPEHLKLEVPNPLLFNQENLYSAEQPGLFMFDCKETIWLWQGWIEPDSEIPSEGTVGASSTGSGLVRWHAERRAAMSTMLDYEREVEREEHREGVALRLVWAGHEPQKFINYFPQWKLREDIHQYNKEWIEGEDVEEVYAALSRTEYSWSQLQDRPFPPGVDPSRIEQYLSSSTFQERFKMSKDDFQALPRWKQIEMKKEVGLF